MEIKWKREEEKMARYGQEKARRSVPRLSRRRKRKEEEDKQKKSEWWDYNDGASSPNSSRRLSFPPSCSTPLDRDGRAPVVERERTEWRNRKERETERERTGENLAVSPSPLLVRSSILRHSRRGLITAYHCCHGNSRSVKNLSALTLIVRLKFRGERVEFTLRTG